MTADQIEKELEWERGVDYPEWGHTDVYLNTISRGYCLPGETPKDAYWRVATTVANRLKETRNGRKVYEIHLERLVKFSITCIK